MRKLILAAALTVAASPAWAEGGRIACQQELGDIVRWADDDAPNPRSDVYDWIEVAAAQCRYSTGMANATMEALRDRLGVPSGQQVGYAGDALEWTSVADLAD